MQLPLLSSRYLHQLPKDKQQFSCLHIAVGLAGGLGPVPLVYPGSPFLGPSENVSLRGLQRVEEELVWPYNLLEHASVQPPLWSPTLPHLMVVVV